MGVLGCRREVGVRRLVFSEVISRLHTAVCRDFETFKMRQNVIVFFSA